MTGEIIQGEIPEFLIPVSDARDFMRGVAEEESVWHELHEQGGWGGHLHRALLHIAVSGFADEEKIDIVPAYIKAYMEDPKWGETGDRALKKATRSITYAIEDVVYKSGTDGTVADLEAAMAHTTQSELPGVTRKYNDEF